jgi:hypothetical protein
MAVIGLALAAAACNATGATPIPTRATAPTAAPATTAPSISTPPALRGLWTAEVIGTSASSGRWILAITETNISLQNPVGGEPFTLDPVSMTSTSLVLPAASDCPDQSVVTPGTYTLALIGDRLVITLIGDSCGDRSATLTTSPWKRTS